MKLFDANVLVYSVHSGAEHHEASRLSIESALSSSETVLLPWVSLLAFARLTTNPRVFQRPLRSDDAVAVIEDWLAQPNAQVPQPDGRHPQRLRELLSSAGGRGGNLVNDAHLAAIAIEWGATLLTFDSDFAKFPGLDWKMPEA